MQLDRDLRTRPFDRGALNQYAVCNPRDELAGVDLTPTTVTVVVMSEDKVTTFATVTAAFSQPVSDYQTIKQGFAVRAWVAVIPASPFGGADRVLVQRTLVIGGTTYPLVPDLVTVVGP